MGAWLPILRLRYPVASGELLSIYAKRAHVLFSEDTTARSSVESTMLVARHTQWLTPVILALGRLKQEDYLKFQASLGYRISLHFLEKSPNQTTTSETKQKPGTILECQGLQPRKEVLSYIRSPCLDSPRKLPRSPSSVLVVSLGAKSSLCSYPHQPTAWPCSRQSTANQWYIQPSSPLDRRVRQISPRGNRLWLTVNKLVSTQSWSWKERQKRKP